MEAMGGKMRVLGISDEVTTCENCGKKELKCTVALETESGDVVRFGRDCAGAALYGKKSAKHTAKAEMEARTIRIFKRYIAQGKTPKQAADMLCFHRAYVIDISPIFGARMQTDRGMVPVLL